MSKVYSIASPPRNGNKPLSLHDALPISNLFLNVEGVLCIRPRFFSAWPITSWKLLPPVVALPYLQDRKSTRLNSSHSQSSYAVFCLKKKKKKGKVMQHTLVYSFEMRS